MDQERYRQLFLKEGREQIEAIDRCLPALLEGGGAIDEALRAFHSIKGMAASMGYEEITEYTHLLEGLLERLKEGTLRPSKGVIALLKKGRDGLEEALWAIEEGREVELDLKALEEGMASIGEGTDRERKVGVGVAGLRVPKTVRVEAGVFDRLQDLIGEVLTSYVRIRGMAKETGSYLLSEECHYGEDLLRRLHHQILQMRLIPFRELLYGLHRIVEDYRGAKEVELAVEGEGVELDRAILERLLEPLVHLIRNAIDHGIEEPEERAAKGKPPKGRIGIALAKERGEVKIEVSDDGRGMDEEKIRERAISAGIITEERSKTLTREETFELLYTPGFSLSGRVTETSGRGVGMDVVREVVKGLGGSVRIDSKKGIGTKITLRLPATGAIMRILIISKGRTVFGVPVARVDRVVEPGRIFLKEGGSAMALIDNMEVPVIDLENLSPPRTCKGDGTLLVVCRGGKGPIGLLTEEVLGEMDGYIKDLPLLLRNIKGVSGYTFMEEERPVFIIEPGTIGL